VWDPKEQSEARGVEVGKRHPTDPQMEDDYTEGIAGAGLRKNKKERCLVHSRTAPNTPAKDKSPQLLSLITLMEGGVNVQTQIVGQGRMVEGRGRRERND